MKYDPNRNYLHPVMRPYSDDYKDNFLTTSVGVQASNEDVTISLKFDVSDVRIRQQVTDGNARCTAMLYCRDTLYRKTLESDIGSFTLTESVPMKMLVNNVELNPAIVTFDDVEHPTDTAHKEYGDIPVQIGKLRPIATDQTWHFQVNPRLRPTESIFILEPDDEFQLQDGEFDIDIDPAERYITIKANAATLSEFKLVRSNETLAVSTVFISALIEALTWMKNAESYDDGGIVASDGWIVCIKNNLQKQNINLGSVDEAGNYSLFRAAQRLLDYPFGELINIRET